MKVYLDSSFDWLASAPNKFQSVFRESCFTVVPTVRANSVAVMDGELRNSRIVAARRSLTLDVPSVCVS